MDISTEQLNTADKLNVYELIQNYSKQRVCGNALFGIDEFPNKESVEYILDTSRSYSVKIGSQSIGYVIVTPSVFVRGHAPMYAEIRIVPNNSETRFDEVFPTLLNVGSNQAGCHGYEACIYETYSSNSSIITTVRRHGYHLVATLPRCGCVFDQGWQASFVLMKTLRNLEECLPFRSPAPPDRWWSKTFIGERKLTLKMPITVKDKNGKEYLFDTARADEVDTVYDLFIQASNSGKGYTHQEIPSRKSLMEVVTQPCSSRIFVFRDAGEVVGAWYVDPSIYSRSAKPVCCDSWGVFAESYRNKGLMTRTYATLTRVLLDLGYEGMLFDAFVNNPSSIRVSTKNGGVIVGLLPYSGYLTGHGWVDSLLFYGDQRKVLLPSTSTSKL